MTQIEMDVARSTLRKNKAVVDSIENVDWERRRYEIAKDALCAIIVRYNENYLEDYWESAKEAVRYADALIEELNTDKK